MTKYLNPDLVCRAFKRLASRNRTGKTHLERTSGLMYFLAFDAACKKIESNGLDINPERLGGKNNRKQIALEFTKLVLVENNFDNLKQVTELGKVEIGGTVPEKRISSNFFTVPVKKASEQQEPYYYPRRPAPLLKMGPVATHNKWGIKHHDDWKDNLPVFLSEIRDSTPFMDLAIFVCRDCQIDENFDDLVSALGDQLDKRFTKEFSKYWITKIIKEKILARHLGLPFSDYYSSFVKSCIDDEVPIHNYDAMEKSDLVKRILFLEAILTDNNIDYPDLE